LFCKNRFCLEVSRLLVMFIMKEPSSKKVFQGWVVCFFFFAKQTTGRGVIYSLVSHHPPFRLTSSTAIFVEWLNGFGSVIGVP